MARTTYEEQSSLWVKIVGWVCLTVGLLGLVLPILPGIPLMLAGLAALSTQHRWARALMLRLKSRYRKYLRERKRG